MTIEEFNEKRWSANTWCLWNNKKYEIVSVDFEQGLIGILEENIESISWKRCENIELINN